VQVSPRSMRKSRQLQVSSTSKRPIIYHRKSRSRVQAFSPPIPTTPTQYFPAPQSEFTFGHNQEDQVEQTPLEDKVGLLLFLDLSGCPIDSDCYFYPPSCLDGLDRRQTVYADRTRQTRARHRSRRYERCKGR
jgi:hypothetical protein